MALSYNALSQSCFIPKSYSIKDTKQKSRSNVVFASNDKRLSLQTKGDNLMDRIKWDDNGLAVAIAQNVDTGAVLMQGFVNREALSTTISSRKATFFSPLRSTLLTKGETCKNFINILDVYMDCDRDSIIYLGTPDGEETCYYTSVFHQLNDEEPIGKKLALTIFKKAIPSWTRPLVGFNRITRQS